LTADPGHHVVASDALVAKCRFVEFAVTKQNARFGLDPVPETLGPDRTPGHRELHRG